MGDAPPDPAEIDWEETGLVSLFLRDRIGEPPSLAEGTVRSEVQLAEGEGGIRKRLREQIRSNERRGWLVESRPGADVHAAALEGFEAAYAETMARTGAARALPLLHRVLPGDPRQRPGLAAAGKPRARIGDRGSDRGRQRRTSALLPRRHRR